MMKKIRSWAVGLYHKIYFIIVIAVIERLYNYTKKQKDSGDESITKYYLSYRKLLFSFRMMPIVNILKDIDRTNNRYIKAKSAQFLNESAINRVTSGDTYDFLKQCSPQEARDIITHFFPKQKDFDILVKNIENNDKEGFEIEISKRDNSDFYKYCGGANMVARTESNASNSRLTSFSYYSAKSANRIAREARKIDTVTGLDLSEMIKTATDFDDSNIESVLPIYKSLLNIIIKSEDDTWINNRQKIYKIFSDPFVKEIFDGQKYIEERELRLKEEVERSKNTPSDISSTTKTSTTTDTPFILRLIGTDEEKSKIITKLTKYIDSKGTVVGLDLAQLVVATSEMGWLIIPNKIRGFHTEMKECFGDRLGTYEALNKNLNEFEILDGILSSEDENNAQYIKAKVNRRTIERIKITLTTAEEQQ